MAELLGKVKFESVVGVVLPQRGEAVGTLEEEEGDVLAFQAGGDGEAGGASADDDSAGDAYASFTGGMVWVGRGHDQICLVVDGMEEEREWRRYK